MTLLEVREGESLGILGLSGSGKTTLGRILAGHLAPDSGQVLLEGAPLHTSWTRHERQMRRRIQLLQQDPWDALSPRLTVRGLVREPLDVARRPPGRLDGPRRDGRRVAPAALNEIADERRT
ncbi:MAG TPA: ATP-binding cassette domain-containing protein [Acidimicrobiales bacterium]|nr:ATP-binding cassette domain-containing protein [Acidimicrobiales bacterium]